MENFKTSTEANGSHMRYVRFTTQLPLAPDRNEMLYRCLVPKAASHEWRTQSQRAYLRTNGPPGMLQIDDHENFAGFIESHSGSQVPQQEVVLDAGTTNRVADELAWRGTVYDADKTKQTMRAFWREWHTRISADVPVSV